MSRDLLTQNLYFKNTNVKDNEFFMCAKSDFGTAPSSLPKQFDTHYFVPAFLYSLYLTFPETDT